MLNFRNRQSIFDESTFRLLPEITLDDTSLTASPINGGMIYFGT